MMMTDDGFKKLIDHHLSLTHYCTVLYVPAITVCIVHVIKKIWWCCASLNVYILNAVRVREYKFKVGYESCHWDTSKKHNKTNELNNIIYSY